jgi:hypothetical protein
MRSYDAEPGGGSGQSGGQGTLCATAKSSRGAHPCVREGGEVLQTINLDRVCFASMLGGTDRRTLFMMAS